MGLYGRRNHPRAILNNKTPDFLGGFSFALVPVIGRGSQRLSEPLFSRGGVYTLPHPRTRHGGRLWVRG